MRIVSNPEAITMGIRMISNLSNIVLSLPICLDVYTEAD